MCLTGVDYFSTLGYQPGIAFLAAGILSPLATLVLVLLTLFGALPMYRRVAELSPHGQGSISLLEELLPRWRGKALVLCLLGFAATGFIITITLSAADATAHIIENPLTPRLASTIRSCSRWCCSPRSARSSSRDSAKRSASPSPSSRSTCVLNVVVVGWGLHHLWQHPEALPAWRALALAEHGSWTRMIGVALVLFPQLALGLSGFETGVAVMPLVQGDPDDDPKHPKGRIRNAQQAADDRRADHERDAGRQQHRHDDADSAGGVPARAAKRTAARWRISPTSTSATPSARSTTSARWRSSGSPARRRWSACSTSCRSTCRATGWRPSGPRPTARSC